MQRTQTMENRAHNNQLLFDELCNGVIGTINNLSNKTRREKFEKAVLHYLGIQLQNFIQSIGLPLQHNIRTLDCFIFEFIRFGGTEYFISLMQSLEQIRKERYKNIVAYLQVGWRNYHQHSNRAYLCLGPYLPNRIRQAAYFILIEQDARKAVEAIYGLLEPEVMEIGSEVRNSITNLKLEIRQLLPNMAGQFQELEHWIDKVESIGQKKFKRRTQNIRP